MKQQTAQEIEQEAADWAAKVDRGLSHLEQSDLDRWLSEDVRRVGAYGRIRAVALQTERVAALGPVHSPRYFHTASDTPVSRRRMLVGAGTIAASVGAIGAGSWLWLAQSRFHTRKGEVRQVALEDGSVVMLNTASDVTVRLTKERREVSLLEGEALFDVTPDRARPFVVIAGNVEARVLGTSFIVRSLPGEPVQVLVREGVVEVGRTGAATARPLRLTANTRALAGKDIGSGAPDLVATAVPEATVRRALAWRDGHIDFEGETLIDAAAEFVRYSDTRIVVDPRIANEQIAGVYKTSDPIGFAKAVATSLRATTQISESEIRIHQQM